jgi:hypothetical protein
MSKERRKHPRIDFGHGGEALIRQRLNIELTDLSVGGMGFKANIPMEPDSICDLVLFNGNLSIESHVASCSKVDRNMPKYRIGARFTKVSAQLLEEVLEMEKRFKNRKSSISTTLRKTTPQVAVFKFPERLTIEDREDMIKAVQDQLDESIRHFVADFTKVIDIEAGFISQLVEIDEEVRFEGGVFIMANSSSKLLGKRQVSELATTIPIFETVNKAVNSIKNNQVTPKE